MLISALLLFSTLEVITCFTPPHHQPSPQELERVKRLALAPEFDKNGDPFYKEFTVAAADAELRDPPAYAAFKSHEAAASAAAAASPELKYNSNSASSSGSGSGGHQHQHPVTRRHNNNTARVSNQGHQKQQKTPFNEEDLIVSTESGYVRGRTYLVDHHIQGQRGYPYGRKKYRVNAWLGIPYAEKPVGDLRFKRPVPVKSWSGVLNATEMPNSCYQLPDTVISDFPGVEMWNPNTNVSEDCLYLNIWSPHPKPRNAAVMVWIYGGGFYSGTSTLKVYDPKVITSETQLIFISMQYRVSIFGFLFMDHEDAPGNQGLLDQYLALKWIHNNVQYFGGDNTRITIFGESAGAVSVSLHLLSRMSANLFRNAILQSGTALSDWATLTHSEALKRGTEILEVLGCTGNKTEILACAHKLDPRLTIEKSDEHFYTKATQGIAQFTFVPIVDNYFLEDEPMRALNDGKFKKCPILIGANKDEGNWFFVYSFPEYRNLSAPPVIDYENFKLFLSSLFHFYPQFPSTSSSAILNAVLYRYTYWNNINNSSKNFESLDDAAGDFHFVCPIVDFANLYAMNQQDVFFYYFTQRSSQHYWPGWLGVMHGDEIPFVFGDPFNPLANYTEGEKTLSRKMLKYWSNFAKYENPNGPVSPAPASPLDEYRILDEPARATASAAAADAPNRVGLLSSRKVLRRNKIIAGAAQNFSTQTSMQFIEHWPKYQILNNEDRQRAFIRLDATGITVDYNIRAEYCTFWGSYLPHLILSQSGCHCGACLKPLDSEQTRSNGAAMFLYRKSSRQAAGLWPSTSLGSSLVYLMALAASCLLLAG